MSKQITIYWCDFCGSEFATFAHFPVDIMPYCVNCSNDEDITRLGYAEIKPGS
ncbi:hypothetical protein J1P26_22140 [Neobacillus sp. MM2021_6]|uniref:hypothetical protein n=1 Tax=Bacillaceae TaxID=186817 RepID=UPI00140E2CDD|nr:MULTISPECIES: hypothetical protein [Bacillaceae]MBO0962406.1 hypothetical protein [Neobacillus sp. MM2021_6]NHC21025.1 hypothetical protein [Bacillus sp. MM2020_4]